MPHRPWPLRVGVVALLAALLLTTWVLEGPALAATSKPDVQRGDSVSPASGRSVDWCRRNGYRVVSGQEVIIDACLERLPGGVRAHYFFWAIGGTANLKGTLNTCSVEFGCRRSKAFHLRGVGATPVAVATAWDSSCPTIASWYGHVRLLDIRFLPSGELHRGTGPHNSETMRTTAC